MRYQIHHLSCFDHQVNGLNEEGQKIVKEKLAEIRDGAESPRDTIGSTAPALNWILSGTGITKDKIGLGMLEFNLTSKWRIFAYKTGPWTKTTTVKDKHGKPVKSAAALQTVYDGTYWPVKIGHLENNGLAEPSKQLG